MATNWAQSKELPAATPDMAWAQDFTPGMLETIGALEVLAAVGLILLAVLGELNPVGRLSESEGDSTTCS